MWPMSKVGHALECATTAPDGEANLTIEDLLNLVQQAVLLVGQANNTIPYHRRLNALAGTMKSCSKAKSVIKDKSTLLENSGKELFGKEFCDQIIDKVNEQRESKELLFNVFQQQYTSRPFRKATCKVSFIVGAKTLPSREKAMILVPEVGSTATTRGSSKTQGTRRATFFKEIPQLIPQVELSSAHQLV